MNIHTLEKELSIPVENICLVGSRLICGKGNDWDFLVLCREDTVERAGYIRDLDGDFYPSMFASFRKGDVNLIVTQDVAFFAGECAIAYSAMLFHHNRSELDMSNREGRVRFHGYVRNYIHGHLGAGLPPAIAAPQTKS